MTTAETIRTEDAFQIPTYKKLPIALVRGEGAYVWDADGTRYVDFYGGHCVVPIGHSPAPVVAAIQQQAAALMFYSNVVYSPVRAEAAALLAEMAPEGMGHVFFCNSGTEANETALKLARTFTGRPHVVAMTAGFHGRTLGSLIATHGAYRAPYADVLPETTFVPFGDADALDAALAERTDVAAVILEPIQSMAGLYTAPPEYFQRLRATCDAAGALLIFDEVQTGVGRTGTFSISEGLGVRPDLITLAKSLASGVPVGAVLANDAVAAHVKVGDQGTTFGGGMLAMAALTATLRTIRTEGLMGRAVQVFDRLSAGLAGLVREVRGMGCLVGVDLGRKAAPVIAGLLERGFIVGSASDPNVIRLMPPYTIPFDEVDALCEATAECLDAVPA
jgi:acetylornithine/N-succinyldiaminopimelate aminotransferase